MSSSDSDDGLLRARYFTASARRHLAENRVSAQDIFETPSDVLPRLAEAFDLEVRHLAFGDELMEVAVFAVADRRPLTLPVVGLLTVSEAGEGADRLAFYAVDLGA